MTHQAAASLQSIVDKHQITLQSMHNHAVTKSQLAAKKIYKYLTLDSVVKAETSASSSKSTLSSREKRGKNRPSSAARPGRKSGLDLESLSDMKRIRPLNWSISQQLITVWIHKNR